MRAARLRASKFPKPVICTFAPFFSSPAMMPLSSNSAPTARLASALDIFVRMASAAVSSALFTVSPCEGLGPGEALEFRPFYGMAPGKPHKTATIWGTPPRVRKMPGLSLTRPPRLTTLPPPRSQTRSRMPQGHLARSGWIEVIAGVMFSGKSEELIRRVRRAVIARKRVQVFKSHLDARYAGIYSISSHDGRTVEAVPADSAAQIGQQIDPIAPVIPSDEAQFMDDGIVVAANDLADRGVRVMLAGIGMDFRGLPFGSMPTLLAAAGVGGKLPALCLGCGG